MYVLFHDKSFPGYVSPIDAGDIVKDAHGVAVTATTLSEQLNGLPGGQAHTLISLHGAYFPCTAWPAIYQFLQGGGNLIVAGGPAFSRPVHWKAANGGSWEAEPETWIYCRQLRLGPFVPIDLASVCYEEHVEHSNSGTATTTASSIEYALMPTRRAHFLLPALRSMIGKDKLLVDPTMDTFWASTPQLSETNSYPGEEGSTGALDTMLLPLATVHPVWSRQRVSGQQLATPLLILDQLNGSFRGGRWLIIPWSRRTLNAQAYYRYVQLIGACYPLVAAGSKTLDIQPTLSCYRMNERPTIQIEWQRPRNKYSNPILESGEKWCIRLTVKAPGKQFKEIFDLSIPMNDQESDCYEYPLPFAAEIQGMYTLVAIYSTNTLPDKKLYQTDGFITWNDDVARLCDRLRPGRNLFFKSQQDNPCKEQAWFMFGTTYMDSRVQRHYLHKPNPLRWSCDLQNMKACGVNTIRTGLWCGWRDWYSNRSSRSNHSNSCNDDSNANDDEMDISPPKELMRALDAFIMVICRHKLQVIFNIYAFTPTPTGKHPYLDPDSVEQQERFITFLARTYAAFPCVHWDLINEPSFGGPNQLWSGRARPNGDIYEREAFGEWMQQQYTTLDRVRTRWQLLYPEPVSWQQIPLPVDADYNDQPGNTAFRRMLRAGDFTRASQHWFRRWASRMANAIRDTGCKGMVTVGQDEGALRPLPLYHAPAIDFTATHPWWNNNDILWDYLMAKTLNKPAIAEEVGVMLARDLYGRSFRSELNNAALLKRKLYLSLCLGGMIQWLWYTNAYMTSDNECQIGMIRADGSQKPELLIYLKFSDLIERIQHRWLDNSVELSQHATRQNAMANDSTPPSPVSIEQDCLDGHCSATTTTTTTSTVWLVVLDHQCFAHPDLTMKATKMAVRVLSSRFSILPQLVTEETIGQLASYANQSSVNALPTSLQPLPQLVIVPGAQLISDAAFTGLCWLASQQVHVHISGIVEQNEDAIPALLRLNQMGISSNKLASLSASIQPVSRYEMVMPSCASAQFSGDTIEYVKKSTIPPVDRLLRKGNFSWTGIPVELNDQPDIVTALYSQLLRKTPRKDCGLLVLKRPLRHGYLVVLINESSHPISYTLNLNIKNDKSQQLLFPLVVKGEDSGAIVVIHEPNNTSNENGAFLFGGVNHRKTK
ncbi:hypothetical protein BDF22DRAFT_670945 [Syncephalis plumigaleata]|nr:hypothetical protein BDF22DRAFT_670945 [Syncephalis plumigaleata]